MDKGELGQWIRRVAATLRRHGYDAVVVAPADATMPPGAAITFSHHGVVVRDHAAWPDGVGCCLHDARNNQIKPVLLLVCQDEFVGGAGNVARRAVTGNVPPIAVWVLSTADATLDMGDGRIIHVGD